MKRNWKRKIIGGLCLTSVAFVFQACYGTGGDFGYDLLIKGQVKSKKTGLPIKGIKVSVANEIQYVLTGNDGTFEFYTEKIENTKIKFEDIDSNQNGAFSNKDTLLTVTKSTVYLNIELEEN
jgi:hypothetical protein